MTARRCSVGRSSATCTPMQIVATFRVVAKHTVTTCAASKYTSLLFCAPASEPHLPHTLAVLVVAWGSECFRMVPRQNPIAGMHRQTLTTCARLLLFWGTQETVCDGIEWIVHHSAVQMPQRHGRNQRHRSRQRSCVLLVQADPSHHLQQPGCDRSHSHRGQVLRVRQKPSVFPVSPRS